jgi:hypothetical protein
MSALRPPAGCVQMLETRLSLASEAEQMIDNGSILHVSRSFNMLQIDVAMVIVFALVAFIVGMIFDGMLPRPPIPHIEHVTEMQGGE